MERIALGNFGDAKALREGDRAMARVQKSPKAQARRKALTASHRARLVEELRVDPDLEVEYLNAAAEDDDPRIYLSALRAVAEAQGMASVAGAAGVPRESLYRALSEGGNPRFDTRFTRSFGPLGSSWLCGEVRLDPGP